MDPATIAALAALGIKLTGAGAQALFKRKDENHEDKFKSKRKLEDFLASEELKKIDEEYKSKHGEYKEKYARHNRRDAQRDVEADYDKQIDDLKKEYSGKLDKKQKAEYKEKLKALKKDKKVEKKDVKIDYKAEHKDLIKKLNEEYKTKNQEIHGGLDKKLKDLEREELEYNVSGKAPEWFGADNKASREGIGTYSTLTPEQQEASKSILKTGLEGLGKHSPDFSPIAQKYRNEFASETVPSLAERFSGLGAQKSSGFQQALGQAGAGLSQNLAAAEQGHNQQALDYYKSLLGQGLKPQIESYYKPGDVARGGNQYSGISGAFDTLGNGVGDIINAIGEGRANKNNQQQQQSQQNPQTDGSQVPAIPQFQPPAEMSYMDIYRKKNPMLNFGL